ncbi:MAG: enoyl-CoA hydratase-related protein [Pseudomonadota bacterium]
MSEHVQIERDGAILHARLNRPEKKNAMTDGMYAALAEAFQQAEEDQSVKVLLLSGEGDSFTSGNDLSSFASLIGMEADTSKEPPVLALIEAGLRASVPVVAAVEGWCVGIGATMMLHTDFIYAGESAKFHMPFTQLGAVPEAGASRLLTRRFGRQRAARMMIASEVISARTALEWGMITDVVEDRSSFAAAQACAERLCALPPQAVRETKALMVENLDELVPYTRYELERFALRLQSEEMQQVIAARMAAKAK